MTPRKCKQCKCKLDTESAIKTPLFWFCSQGCAFEYAKLQAEKAQKRKEQKVKQVQAKKEKADRVRLRERKEELKPLSKWKKEAQMWFNRFIRMRDAGGCCISCVNKLKSDSRLKGHLFDAGHYRSIGACPELRFHEDNVNAQCVRCNRDLSGNAADYRIGLVKKIGLARVEELERKHPPKRYTVESLKELIATYKAKCKELDCD